MIGNTFYFGWEIQLIIFLQTYFIYLTPFAKVFSYFGDQIVTILVAGFVYWCYDKKLGKILCLTVGMGSILNPMVKNIFLRRRPYFDNAMIKCLNPAESEFAVNDVLGQGFSLPSLHATNSVTLYGTLAFYLKKNWITVLAIVLILLIGISRFFIGVHYPTDILAGWIIGFALILFIYFLNSRIKETWKICLILIIIGCIGLIYCRSADYFRGLGIVIGFSIAILIEEKYVNFKNTRSIPRSVLRLIGGLTVFLVITLICKAIFPDGNTYIAFGFRVLRYTISLIFAMALYPLIFEKFDKYFKEDDKIKN